MKVLPRIILALTLLYSGASLAQKEPINSPVRKKRKTNLANIQYGMASYYAGKFNGRATASGEIYDSKMMTAAHNALPFGTWVKITNQRNGRSVIVKVNDRLHHKNKRLVDLSGAAAKKLGYMSSGLTRVKLEVLGKDRPAEIVMDAK